MLYLTIVIVFIITIFFIILTIYTERKQAIDFSNGTWIDNDGNILVLSFQDKLSISFGVQADDDNYEFSEKKYNYSIRRRPFSNKYKIKTNKDLNIDINIVDGIATVYKKNKKVGKFAKNNLLLMD